MAVAHRGLDQSEPKKKEERCHGGQGECLTFSSPAKFLCFIFNIFKQYVGGVLTSIIPEPLMQT